jgi:hypothetical protein
MNSYEVQRLLSEAHNNFHQHYPDQIFISTTENPADFSCTICFPAPILRKTPLLFQVFWNWYSSVQPTLSYSSETLRYFALFGEFLLNPNPDQRILIPVVTYFLQSI